MTDIETRAFRANFQAARHHIAVTVLYAEKMTSEGRSQQAFTCVKFLLAAYEKLDGMATTAGRANITARAWVEKARDLAKEIEALLVALQNLKKEESFPDAEWALFVSNGALFATTWEHCLPWIGSAEEELRKKPAKRKRHPTESGESEGSPDDNALDLAPIGDGNADTESPPSDFAAPPSKSAKVVRKCGFGCGQTRTSERSMTEHERLCSATGFTTSACPAPFGKACSSKLFKTIRGLRAHYTQVHNGLGLTKDPNCKDNFPAWYMANKPNAPASTELTPAPPTCNDQDPSQSPTTGELPDQNPPPTDEEAPHGTSFQQLQTIADEELETDTTTSTLAEDLPSEVEESREDASSVPKATNASVYAPTKIVLPALITGLRQWPPPPRHAGRPKKAKKTPNPVILF